MYYPGSGGWNSAGSMSEVRGVPQATPLPSGQVLVTAGAGAEGTLSSAELYSP